jgi:hypothetical protein
MAEDHVTPVSDGRRNITAIVKRLTQALAPAATVFGPRSRYSDASCWPPKPSDCARHDHLSYDGTYKLFRHYYGLPGGTLETKLPPDASDKCQR